ncbi:MAG TPA: hypothetical protein VGR60_00680, partial [Gemmatimonadales bacterium]|nr:hypothetical protein [Gemmatimonadales bacterium]
ISGLAPTPTGAYSPIRTWLRNLTVMEEKFYAAHGTYSTDQLALGMPMSKTHADAVKQGSFLTIVQAGGRGWWAQGQLVGPDAKGCAIYVGEMKYFGVAPTTPGGTPVGGNDEGRVACDAP